MVRPLFSSILLLSLASFSCDLSSPMRPKAAIAPVAVRDAMATSLDAAAPPSAPARDGSIESRSPLVGAIGAYLAERNTRLSSLELDQLARTIVEESRERNFEPAFVLAVIRVESGFNNFAVSTAGAFGLMQIQLPTGRELANRLGLQWDGTRSLFDPVMNVKLGVAYLDQLREHFGDIRTALAAYNWGPGHIDRRLRRGRAVPAGYSNRVLDNYTEFTIVQHETS